MSERDEMIRAIAAAETRAALSAQIAEDAEKRRAQAETKCIAAKHRAEIAERAVAVAEDSLMKLEQDAAVTAYRATEEACGYYMADQPSDPATRAGYVNATLGILGRIQALRAKAQHPDGGELARRLAKLCGAAS